MNSPSVSNCMDMQFSRIAWRQSRIVIKRETLQEREKVIHLGCGVLLIHHRSRGGVSDELFLSVT